MKRIPVALLSLTLFLLAATHGWAQLTGKSLILQDSSSPARKITLRTPGTVATSYTLIYPSALPGANGYLLTGTTGGQLNWTDPATLVGSLAWLLNGNAGINVPTADAIAAGQNFVGTTGAQELVLGTNSRRRVRVDGTTGNVGIAAAPSATDRLNVHGMINTDSAYNIGSTNWLWSGPALGGRNNVLVGNTGNALVSGDDNTMTGSQAGSAVTSGTNNTLMGSQAGRKVKDGTDNTIMGAYAGANNPSGSANTIIGSTSANFASSGDNNTVIGAQSATLMISGDRNTLLGSGALSNGNVVSDITLLGALTDASAASNATAIGSRALVEADNSMVLGSINGVNGALADVNVGIGTTTPSQKFEVMDGNILMSNQGQPMQLRIQEPSINGANYTGFTTQAQAADIVYTLPGAAPAANNYLMTSTTGGVMSWSSPSSVVGSVGWLLTGNNITSGGTGANQQFIGTITGNKQPFVMATNGAERARIDSNGLVGIGTAPLASSRVNVRGMVNTDSAYQIDGDRWLWPGNSGSDNTLVGNTTNSAVSGDDNTLVGFRAGAATTSGVQNTVVGSLAGRANTADDNAFFGFGSGGLTSTGSANAFFGSGSGGAVTTGGSNTLLGFASGQGVSTGSRNTLVGIHAGNTLAAASDNTMIGAETGAKTSTLVNATAIGARAVVSGSNMLVLGSINGQNGATSDVNVGIGTPSPNEKLQLHNGNLLLTNGGTAGKVMLAEPSASGSNVTTFAAQAQAADINYTLPAAAPAANGYLMSATTGGTMSWADPASVVGSTAWLLTGNNITAGGTGANQQFIGTTAGNAQPFVTATNGVERMRVDNTGHVLIGTTTPIADKLSVYESVVPPAVTDVFTTQSRLAFAPAIAWNGLTVATGLRSDVVVANTFPSDGERIAGIIAAGTMDPAATSSLPQLRGLRANVIQANTSQTLVHGIAVEGNVQNFGANMTNGTSILATMSNFPTSVTGTYRGMWVKQPDAGTVNATIGIDIDPLTMAASNTAFRYNHSTSPVVISGGGSLGVGTASPGQKVEVKDGNVLLSNSGTADQLRFAEPSAGGTNYTSFAAQAQAADINYTLPAALPVANDYVLTSSTGGAMQWQSATTLAGGNFVQYNVPTPQATALATNYLYNVRYGGLGAGVNALGAAISSTSGTNASATGLAISSTANGTGTSTALTAAATGGTNNYAATFTAGNVGIGTAAPANKLTVVAAAPTTATTDYTGTEIQTSFAPTVAYAAQVNGTETILDVNNSAALTATLGTINALDAGTFHNAAATVSPSELTGIRGWAASNNSTVATKYAKGVYGYIQNNGKIDSAAGFYTDASGSAGSSLGTWRGLHVGNAVGIPVTNTIGIDINKQAEGSASNLAFRYNNPASPIVMLSNGNVGVGISNPNSKLYVNEAIGTANRDTQMVAMWYTFSPTANPAPSVSVAGQIIRMLVTPTVAQTSGLISGADMGAGLQAGATAGLTQLNGIRGFSSSGSTTQTLTHGVGVLGHIQNAGLMTNGMSLEANAQFLPNGVLTNYYGLKVATPSMSGGTVANVYGIDIDQLSGGTSSNTAFRYNHATLPTVIKADGSMGVGTATPGSLFEVNQPLTPGATTQINTATFASTVAPTAAYTGLAATATTTLLLNNTVAVTSGNVRAHDIGAYVLSSATGAVTRLEGSRSFARNQSATSVLATGVGVEGLVWADGRITNGMGVSVGPTISPSGNMTTFTGLNVEQPNLQAGGVLTNMIGVDIAAQTLATNNTALRYNHATAPFIITGGGNVGIGNSTPTVSLDVNGGVVLREDATVANVPNDNFPITVGNRSYLRIGCTTPGAASIKTITLSAGLRVGQVLVIEGTGINAFEIDDNAATNRTNTPAARQMVNNAVETMIWNGTAWMEMSFAAN